MARLPEFKNIAAEEFPEQRTWIAKLLIPLNRFMLNVYSAFNKQINVNDNMQGEIKTGVFINPNNFPVRFTYSLFSKFGSSAPAPVAVMLGSIVENGTTAPVSTATTLSWTYREGSVYIENITNLDTSKTYTANFVILSN